jgi:AcrR family transcriptional regulator
VGETPRGRARREQLLDATAELVAARGFHSVGIAEIGAAAGVTGSAIYRHFDTKLDLLVAVLDGVVNALLEAAEAAVRDASGPDDALTDLVQSHLEFALGNRAVITVWNQEAINLPDDDRRRLRRKQRAYVQLWADALAVARPELGVPESVAVASAAIGLVNSVAAFDTSLSDDDLGALVGAMARNALHAGVPSTTSISA